MTRQDAAETVLPPGFEAQATHQFRDPSGRFSYEFSHVYGPPQPGRRGLVCRLDEQRSYWSVVGQVDEYGKDHHVRRSVSYAEARRAHRGRLTFAEFASEMHMRRELPRLTAASGPALAIAPPRG